MTDGAIPDRLATATSVDLSDAQYRRNYFRAAASDEAMSIITPLSMIAGLMIVASVIEVPAVPWLPVSVVAAVCLAYGGTTFSAWYRLRKLPRLVREGREIPRPGVAVKWNLALVCVGSGVFLSLTGLHESPVVAFPWISGASALRLNSALILAGIVFLVVKFRSSPYPRPRSEDVEEFLAQRRRDFAQRAASRSNVDLGADIVESIVLATPRWRPPVDGVRYLRGVLIEDPYSSWLPFVLGAESNGSAYVQAGRYTVHALLADEVGVYYDCAVYDFMDDKFYSTEVGEMDRGRFHYQKINDVKVNANQLAMVVGSETFVFPLSLGVDGAANHRPTNAFIQASDLGSYPHLTGSQWSQCRMFIASMSRLREDWMRRQR